MDPPCATCRFATRNGASQQTQCAACGRHANRQTTVCFQSDPHVADRMLLSHRTSRSEAVNALKLQLTAGAPPTSCVAFFLFFFKAATINVSALPVGPMLMSVSLATQGHHTEHSTLSEALFALCLFFGPKTRSMKPQASVFLFI